MTDAPERIFAWPADATGAWSDHLTGRFGTGKPVTKQSVEYVRADLATPTVQEAAKRKMMFLCGSGPNDDGKWFDEVAKERNGNFWWRKELRELYATLSGTKEGE